MTRRDVAGLLLLSGAAALWSSVSGAALDYVRPSMRWWLGAAGVLLVVLGAAEAWRARGGAADASDELPSRVGWMIALPVCVAVTVGSGSLGVYAVGRNATYRDLPDAPTSFDLEQYVTAKSVGGQPVELTLVDLRAAASTSEGRAVLGQHELEAVGFISEGDDGEHYLTRFVISCCAADAASVRVQLAEADRQLSEGDWVRVVGTLEPDGAAQADDDIPVLRMSSTTSISEPDLPYEVPVSRIR